MTSIHDIAAHIKALEGVTFLSDIKPAPSDIDIFVPDYHLSELGPFLEREGFVLSTNNAYQLVYRRFEDGVLYIIDLMSDMNIYTLLLPGFKFSTHGSERIGHNPILHKCIKYFCLKKYDRIEFLNQNKETWAPFMKEQKNFITRRNTPLNAREDAETFFSWIHKRASFSSFISKWRARLHYLNKGVSIAFIGPDGSGKSFLIDKLRPIGRTKAIYMGDWFFWDQPFYNLLLRIPSPFNRFIYFFYVIENYLRQLKVWFYKFLGYIVLIDRFPGTNRNAAHTGALGAINRFIFRIFPKPNLIALLMAPPEVVYARKQELNLDQIQNLQNALAHIIQNERHVLLNTEDLDKSLNTILAAAYPGTKLKMYTNARYIKDKIRIYAACFLYLCKGLLGARYNHNCGKTRVLVFHHLDKPALFGKILQILQRKYNIISFEDYLNARTNPTKINVIIALDDGYNSWHRTGLPLFKKYAVSPLLFINTGFVGSDLSDSHAFCTNNIHTWPEQAASWDQIKDLTAAGAEIGGHTDRHVDLTGPLSSDKKSASISNDRANIAQHLGPPPRSFAYPYGRYNQEAILAAKDAGYSYAFTSDSGFLDESENHLQLKRTNVGLRHPIAVCAMVEGWADVLSHIYGRFKKAWPK